MKAIDDDWLVSDVGTRGRGVEIQNPRTGHIVILAYDQIHHFSEDIARDWKGQSHGVFELRAQLALSGPQAIFEPLPYSCPNCGAATPRSKTGRNRGSPTVGAAAPKGS